MKQLYGFESHGILVTEGCYLFPNLICKAMITHPNIKISYHYCFENWFKNKSKIDIQFINQEKKSGFDVLIIANGPSLEKYLSGLKISKGQLVGLKGDQPIDLDLPINSAGYILPKVNEITWIGSTHEREFENMDVCLEAGHELIKRTNKNFDITLAGLDSMVMKAIIEWAATTY